MAERTWRFESKSSPGTWHTTTLGGDGRLDCTCKGFAVRRDCSHCGSASAELAREGLGYDPFQPEHGEPPRLFTSAYWAWRPGNEIGVPCQITIGAPPADFPAECDQGLRWALAPWPPLFSKVGEEFETAYRQKLDQVGVARMRQSIAQIARRHPGQPLTLLCWEPVWQKPDYTCHRRLFAAWWQEQTGEAVEEWPPRPRSSSTQPPTTHQSTPGSLLAATGDHLAPPGDQPTHPHEGGK